MRRDELHRLLDMALDIGQKLIACPVMPEAQRHFKAAKRETLLGIRDVIDTVIARLDDAPKTADDSPLSVKIE